MSENKDYLKRYSFWTERATTQLGYSINIFVVIEIGFIGFLFTQIDHILLTTGVVKLIYAIVVLFSVISVGLGLFGVLSRLTDYRLTRHIIDIRRKTNNKNKDNSTLPRSSSVKITKRYGRNYFKAILPFYIHFIDSDGFQNEDFIRILEQSKYCGEKTWLFHQRQIEWFIFSIASYLMFFVVSIFSGMNNSTDSFVIQPYILNNSSTNSYGPVVIGGVFGLFSALIGAYIGARLTGKNAMDVFKAEVGKQNDNEQKELEKFAELIVLFSREVREKVEKQKEDLLALKQNINTEPCGWYTIDKLILGLEYERLKKIDTLKLFSVFKLKGSSDMNLLEKYINEIDSLSERYDNFQISSDGIQKEMEKCKETNNKIYNGLREYAVRYLGYNPEKKKDMLNDIIADKENNPLRVAQNVNNLKIVLEANTQLKIPKEEFHAIEDNVESNNKNIKGNNDKESALLDPFIKGLVTSIKTFNQVEIYLTGLQK